MEKMISRVGLTMSTILKFKETSGVKMLLHKGGYGLARKCNWYYRSADGMLIYIQGLTQP